MNTMQSFYASLSSSDTLSDTYLKILADLSKINREQANALMSDMAWQSWDAQSANTVTA